MLKKFLAIILLIFVLHFENSHSQEYDIHVIVGYVYCDGNAIAGVNLTIFNEDRMEKAYAETDKYGFYKFFTRFYPPFGGVRNLGWKTGERLTITARGLGEYSGWVGKGSLIINDAPYQWLNISLYKELKADFYYMPLNPTDLEEIQFIDKSNGDIVNYTWNFGDNNISYEKNPKHRYADDGIYNVSLIVRDSNGNFDTCYKNIVVENLPPVASFSYSIDNLSIEVDASSSFDLDGKIIRYEWKWKNDGKWQIGKEKTHHLYSNEGNYTIWLRVTDDDYATNITKIEISVKKKYKNMAPIVNFSWNPPFPTDLDEIEFIDNSYDLDGYIVNYTWHFGDGNISFEKNPKHRYANDGIYNVSLIVKDNRGTLTILCKKIIILNAYPVASFSWKPKKIAVRNEIKFIDKSYDLDGYIVNHTWNFGDGNISFEKNPKHRYSKAGIYNVSLCIIDNDGAIAIKEEQIKIYKKETPSFEFILLAFALLILLARKWHTMAW